MVGQRRAALFAEPSQHIKHAGRQELLADFGDHEHAEWRILSLLQDQRIASAKRRPDLQRGEEHRRVPWDDGADHAKRLTPCVAQHMLAKRDGLAFQFAAQAAKIT